MEDEVRYNRNAFTAPSVDPLDAALERMESARSAGTNVADDDEDDELDVDVNETTNNTATTDDEPDYDDEEFTDEANTPDEEEVEQSRSQESQRKAKKSTASKPEASKDGTAGSDEEEDDRPLSRKQRGKLIEELRQTIEDEQRQRQKLEAELASRKADEEKLNQEINRALGTDEEYEKATEDGLSGDTSAAEKARIWKSNRAFYSKLLKKADAQAREEFTNFYWNGLNGLPGVTQEALTAPKLSDILKNLYDAGVASVQDESTSKIEKLTEEVETWKGRYRSLKAKAGGAKRSPVGGGAESVGVTKSFDWQSKYIDPKTGLFTDEADAIISRYGLAGLKDPKLRKAR